LSVLWQDFAPNDYAVAAQTNFDVVLCLREKLPTGDRIAHLSFAYDQATHPIRVHLRRCFVFGVNRRAEENHWNENKRTESCCQFQMFCLHLEVGRKMLDFAPMQRPECGFDFLKTDQ